jgi:hypothetical protein
MYTIYLEGGVLCCSILTLKISWGGMQFVRSSYSFPLTKLSLNMNEQLIAYVNSQSNSLEPSLSLPPQFLAMSVNIVSYPNL